MPESGNITPIVEQKFYSFFTKYSLLDNYGFTSGLVSRIFRKFIPEIPEQDTFEFYLKEVPLASNDSTPLTNAVQEALGNPTVKAAIEKDLDKSIVALSTRIISHGLDREFQSMFEKLQIDASCYVNLLNQVNILYTKGTAEIPRFHKNLDAVHASISGLRKNKNVIGTSFHLTLVTKRILDYIKRTKSLLDLKEDIHSTEKWWQLILDYRKHDFAKNSLRRHFKRHADLLALEIVEHTSQKGEKYTADDLKEYKSFFKKGLLGGAVIAVFALFKMLIDASISSDLPLALMYSINYASCFVLVKLMGGTIATKQPAMTASTITRHIDKNNNLRIGDIQDIILLVRKVSRSQFISLLGNFTMALSMACLIGYLLRLGFVPNPIDSEKSLYLIEKVFPFSGGALYYAAIAGLFLSLSGFISGYFDNKVIASNLPYRIQHNSFLSRFLSQRGREKISVFLEKKLGTMAGNISLGFFLGSVFLLSYILPFKVDIRHIAFSSSNVGYGIMNHAFSLSTIALALVSVLIIGLVNFVVSFFLTFMVALESREVTTKDLGQLIKLSIKDIFSHPLDYLMIRKSK